jgi:hypothetical protein
MPFQDSLEHHLLNQPKNVSPSPSKQGRSTMLWPLFMNHRMIGVLDTKVSLKGKTYELGSFLTTFCIIL